MYLSDGGHFDKHWGLYELVRRRCRYIVICDSEADSQLTFQGIGMAVRKCRIDFGAEVSPSIFALSNMPRIPTAVLHIAWWAPSLIPRLPKLMASWFT